MACGGMIWEIDDGKEREGGEEWSSNAVLGRPFLSLLLEALADSPSI